MSELDHQETFKEKIWRVIFRSDTAGARGYDIALLIFILASVIVVMAETVEGFSSKHQLGFARLEWFFTIVFTIEYLTRIFVVRNKGKYVFSFFGVVDLLSILPTYIELFLTGSGYFIVIRILRLLRMFRIFKMARHMGEANVLINALKAGRPKIAVFLFGVLAVTIIMGTIMYMIEGVLSSNEGFSSIPQGIYWAIVTLTTVGYGDVTPITVVGKMIASCMMILGYAVIAVPTGIVTAEIGREMGNQEDEKIIPGPYSSSSSSEELIDLRKTQRCEECGLEDHHQTARFCRHCGSPV